MTHERIPNVLSIAGSDPSGGAGVQADLKAFSALGAYGMCALTALTAQNTTGVRGVSGVDAGFLREQLDAVFEDIRVDAVKIGMIGTAASVEAVAACLERHDPAVVVVDPVMVAKSGDRLIDDAATTALRERLLPLASLVTPNLPETAVLLGDAEAPATPGEMEAAGIRLMSSGVRAVLVKGGHLAGDTVTDVLCDAQGPREFSSARVRTANTHGTGCTLSSAIAALATPAPSMADAVAAARRYLVMALGAADRLTVGHGCGPVHHFADAWIADPARRWLDA
jgi:hydroxymethylpyrimidine/phosphomethylpyrimidine kinase